MITLQQMCKTYGNSDKQAVKDVSVQIKEGEFFVLVGPSGCGKSTLLRMIAGLEEITSGTLSIHHVVSNHLPPKDRKLSMVFQNYALYPHLSVEENIVFGLKVRKTSRAERQKRLEEASEMVGLTDYLKVKPRELSGGQRQRVALARTIVSRAPICLMDEPLSNLDAKLRAQMRMEIREIQQRLGITMIYVTHDQVEAMTMGDRMMVLNNGEIQQVGTPLDLYNKPENEFVAGFIGSPAMNLADCKISSIKNQAIIGNIAVSLPEMFTEKLAHRDVRIGIRPENILICEKSGERSLANQPADEGSQQGQRVTVKSVEVLGNESIVHFAIEDQIWSAKTPGQVKCKKGDVVYICPQMDKIHFFDKETKKAILIPNWQEVWGV